MISRVNLRLAPLQGAFLKRVVRGCRRWRLLNPRLLRCHAFGIQIFRSIRWGGLTLANGRVRPGRLGEASLPAEALKKDWGSFGLRWDDH